MKNSRNQYIAIGAGLALIGYLFFSGPFLNLFRSAAENSDNQLPQSSYALSEITAGEGEIAEPGDRLTVHYVVRLVNGQIVDTSRDSNTPFTFVLGAGQVIRGWDEGIQGMRVGGSRLLVVAPDYAYGSDSRGPIPPDSTLVFEIELLKVEKGR